MEEIVNIHLVSDSTAETVQLMNESIVSQFPGMRYRTFLWPIVNKRTRVNTLVNTAKERPGIVLYTLFSQNLAQYLVEQISKVAGCHPIAALDYVMLKFSEILGRSPSSSTGRQRLLNSDYYRRIESVQFTYEHDDGKRIQDAHKADIVLIGVSRTSKTPTSAYLAHRGFKVLNIPLTGQENIIESMESLNGPLIIGLTINPERLQDIRKTRIHLEKTEKYKNTYIELDKIKEEMANARKIFVKLNCHVIDVTNRSIEETAAYIIRIYQIKHTVNDSMRVNAH